MLNRRQFARNTLAVAVAAAFPARAWSAILSPTTRVERDIRAVTNSAAQTDADGVSLFTALREQLGLKLEPAEGDVEVVVIERVERPSDN